METNPSAPLGQLSLQDLSEITSAFDSEFRQNAFARSTTPEPAEIEEDIDIVVAQPTERVQEEEANIYLGGALLSDLSREPDSNDTSEYDTLLREIDSFKQKYRERLDAYTKARDAYNSAVHLHEKLSVQYDAMSRTLQEIGCEAAEQGGFAQSHYLWQQRILLPEKRAEMDARHKEFSEMHNIAGLCKSVHAAPICQVCFAATIDTVLWPCCHTACRSCADATGDNCFVCRADVEDVRKIYIA